MARRGGCCALLHLTEDNARFILLAVVLVFYLLAGACLFHYLEHEEEERIRNRFWGKYELFRSKYNETVNMTLLDQLLYEFGNASATGVLFKRPRWDFSGAFYFVATVISTIGYGMTTPQTSAGKVTVVFYGFLGCSGAILFFNLFLERIITLLAYALRAFHVRELRRRGLLPPAKRSGGSIGAAADGRRGSQASLDEADALDLWKPSVYWVMFYLFLAAMVIGSFASAIYSNMENWSYLESMYFCFTSFATIGFGDYVSSQRRAYPHMHLYRFANFVFLVLGCCCIYSLFNVTSIVIKQCLNAIIRKLDCRCRRPSRQKPRQRSRRNAITPNHLTKNRSIDKDPDSTYDSDSERRLSGELICMRDFLHNNKVSLAVMQKELYESAQLQRGGAILIQPRTPDFTPGKVGPLAIVTSKLGDEST